MRLCVVTNVYEWACNINEKRDMKSDEEVWSITQKQNEKRKFKINEIDGFLYEYFCLIVRRFFKVFYCCFSSFEIRRFDAYGKIYGNLYQCVASLLFVFCCCLVVVGVFAERITVFCFDCFICLLIYFFYSSFGYYCLHFLFVLFFLLLLQPRFVSSFLFMNWMIVINAANPSTAIANNNCSNNQKTPKRRNTIKRLSEAKPLLYVVYF